MGYKWKAMRGPRWSRPPILQCGAGIPPQYGCTLRTAGWGPIEAMELAEAMNVTACITLHHVCHLHHRTSPRLR